MQPLKPFRDYSDFLKSGFRAFTNRGRKQQSSETAPHAMLDTPRSSTPKTTFSDTTERWPRPVSMQITPREKARRRRSSFLSFSSHWFNHQSTPDFFNETSTILLRRGSTSSADSGDSEVWMAGGDLYTVPAINGSSDEVFCDPFSSASDAKSVFLDFPSQDDPALSVGTPKGSRRSSFLSFTPSNRSSIFSRRRGRTLSSIY